MKNKQNSTEQYKLNETREYITPDKIKDMLMRLAIKIESIPLQFVSLLCDK